MHVSNDVLQDLEMFILIDPDSSDDMQEGAKSASLSESLLTLASDYEAEGLVSRSATARVLARRLGSVQPEQIVIFRRASRSLRHRMQILVEDTVGFAIDWWPSPEPHRTFDGNNCVVWSCVSLIVLLCIRPN
jgi:hypothetical protein